MEPKGLLLSSKENATGPYSKSDEPSSHIRTLLP